MRWLLALAVLVSPAAAAECFEGRPDAITVKSWAPSAKESLIGEPVLVRYVLNNALDKSIRMIDASVFFDDVLGKHIGGYEVEPDVAAVAGGDFEVEGTYLGMTRLLDANPEDILVSICTKAVVYGDGTTETFE
jgi:hypothetical protein